MPSRKELPAGGGDERDRPASIISPSILSADFACLAQECDAVLQNGADWLHIDVMDGHFVDNLTLGPPVVASLRRHSDAFFDCHLMVSEPAKWVKAFSDAGADMYTFHLECPCFEQPSTPQRLEAVAQLARRVREAGMNVGLALSPATPAAAALPYLDAGDFDLVLCLTVQPGFGGQPFQSCVMGKVRQLRTRYPGLHIEVDGGLSPATIQQAAEAGSNVIVAGSAIFGAPDPRAVISTLRRAVDAAATAHKADTAAA